MKILYKPNQYSQQRQREKKRWIWPVHLAMEATYYREKEGCLVSWDVDNPLIEWDKVITEPEGIPFLDLPHPDRAFTGAFSSKWQQNGNFKHRPGTYIQSASGCWWGKCTFCKECGKKYELRPVGDVISEIKYCKAQGFKEIFDDAASFATGEWRDRFIEQLKPLGVAFSCNMRFGTKPDFKAMKEAGFRMLLYGLESANQGTLNKINKGTNIDKAIHELKLAADCGLENHIAVMFGCPGETHEDAKNTLNLVHYLLKNGYAKTAQASLYNGERPEFQKYVKQIYRAAYSPRFWINKLKEIKTMDDVKYLWRGVKAWIGK